MRNCPYINLLEPQRLDKSSVTTMLFESAFSMLTVNDKDQFEDSGICLLGDAEDMHTPGVAQNEFTATLFPIWLRCAGPTTQEADCNISLRVLLRAWSETLQVLTPERQRGEQGQLSSTHLSRNVRSGRGIQSLSRKPPQANF